jgi:hypothetical protein
MNETELWGIAAELYQLLAGFQQAGLGYLDYLNSRPTASDEAVVRLKIAEPLLAALGYDLQADLDPEHRVKEGAIDILVKADGIPVVLWELKRTQETDLARHEEQLTRYVLVKGVAHAVLCNGRQVRVYQRVGDALRFAYAFSLTAFAPGVLIPPGQDEEMALSVFFDAFRKEAFLEVERLKAEIVATTAHPLVLKPGEPQNEVLLVEDLKREIRRLHRFVLLRFRSHQALYREFLAEKERREGQASQARERMWDWIGGFEERARTPVDRAMLEAYLEAFADNWAGVEEDGFVTEVLSRSGVAGHLVGANHTNFRTRASDFYRAFTDLARWHARRVVELRPIRTLMEDFTHWRDEIGLMAEDYEAEFCLQTVYIFVTRLLLIRICEDKGLITQKISDGGYKDYLDFSQRFFTNIADAHATLLDMAYKDTGYIYGHFFSRDVFDWYTWEEEAIVRLFWTLNRFDFAQVSADLIGRIYEQYVDQLERKRKGQFYTPPQVVNYILDQVGYRGAEIVGRRLLDPACGSGRFLVEAARRLIAELKKQPGLLPKELVNERVRGCLFGLDVNRFACFLAEVNLLVQVLDLVRGDQTFTIQRFHIYPTNTLLPLEREPRLLVGPGNGLAYEAEAAELVKGRGYNPALGLDLRAGFDWVVGNPPYVRADSPGAATQRGRVEASGRYRTLYKKWDLYIPFIEFALQMLAEGGRHGFIASDACQTEEYARPLRELVLKETAIESLTFAPGVRFFEEAQVHNLIYAVRQGAPAQGHKVRRYKAVAPALHPQDLKTLPDLSQAKWGEQIFRPEFEGEEGLDFSGCLRLGEICYVSYGLRPLSADDAPVKFSREEVLSPVKRPPYTKRFVEGKDIQPYYLAGWQWLEWGTERVPAYLYRKTFTELYTSPKVIVGETSGVYYDGKGELFDDHSTRNVVLYHTFASASARQYIARILAREITDDDVITLELTPTELSRLSKAELAKRIIAARAQVSVNYDLRYITALLNCRWLRDYMMAFVRRGSRERFYPDDLKKWPIPSADADTQTEIARLVGEIMEAKADVQRWREAEHRVEEGGVILNPRPFLEAWNIPSGDLIDAASFVTAQVGGHPTELALEGQCLTFRKQPLSYFESAHPHVLIYLRLYLETERDTLATCPVAELPRRIRIPRSPQAVQAFLERLAVEREQVMLRWMVAAQREALIEEWAFDLYDVPGEQREKLGGHLYSFAGLPPGLAFVSILDNEQVNPMRRVAFPKDGGWHYRTQETLPHAVLLWMHDGQRATTEWRAVCGPQ